MTRSAGTLGSGFRRLWSATAVSNLGDGILLVGFPLLAVELTRSPLRVSLVSTLATVPWLLVALHAGALADRYDRRRLMVGAMVLRVAVLAALAITAVIGLFTLPVLYLAVLALGVAEVFADTTAQSMLPTLVGRDRLGAANGRVIAAQTVANDFLGGPVAGVLVGVGAVLVVGAPAALYGLSAALLLTLQGSYRPPSRLAASLRHDITEGVRYLVKHRVLRGLALLAGLLNLAGAAYLAVFVLWAVGDGSAVGLSPQGYGLLMAALAVGGTAGALLTERLVRMGGAPRVLRSAAAILGPVLLLPIWLPTAAVAAASFVAIGFVSSATKVVVVSLAQRLIRDELLGRVNAAYRLIGLGSMPLGALLGGTLGSALGLALVFHATALLCLLALGVAVRAITANAIAAADPHR
jgi:MFS family permease